MGVSLDLMGKQVRCPHCRLVVVAPTNLPTKTKPTSSHDQFHDDTSRHTPPDSASQAFAPSSEGEIPIPEFSLKSREGGESIFGEAGEEEDSLFATSVSAKPLLPNLPNTPDEQRMNQPSGTINFDRVRESRENLPPTDAIESGAIPVPDPIPSKPVKPVAMSQPSFLPDQNAKEPQPPPDLELPAPPAPAATINPASNTVEVRGPANSLMPRRIPTPIDPPSIEGLNPFEKLSRPKMPGLTPNPTPTTPVPQLAQPGNTGRGTLFWWLLIYAVCATIFGVWAFLRSSTHPFTVIPDFFGQYKQAPRNKVSVLPVDDLRPIPPALRVKLGSTLTVGNLQFEPMNIEERRTLWRISGAPGRPREVDCLMLIARIRNLSKDQSFHPMDPAYNRFVQPNQPPPLSGIVIGEKRFMGGPIAWPFVHDGHEYIEGQEQDDKPLGPGETRVTVIPSVDGEQAKRMVSLIQKTPGTMTWQVHVRRGTIEYRGEEVSVGALIGVDFDANQVKRLVR